MDLIVYACQTLYFVRRVELQSFDFVFQLFHLVNTRLNLVSQGSNVCNYVLKFRETILLKQRLSHY